MTQNEANINKNTQNLSNTILSGDVTGTAGSNTVTAIQGSAIFTVGPNSGNVLVWEAVANQWRATSLPSAPIVGNITLIGTTTIYNLASTDTILYFNSTGHVLQLPQTTTAGRIVFIRESSSSSDIGIVAYTGYTINNLSIYSFGTRGALICLDGHNWGII